MTTSNPPPARRQVEKVWYLSRTQRDRFLKDLARARRLWRAIAEAADDRRRLSLHDHLWMTLKKNVALLEQEFDQIEAVLNAAPQQISPEELEEFNRMIFLWKLERNDLRRRLDTYRDQKIRDLRIRHAAEDPNLKEMIRVREDARRFVPLMHSIIARAQTLFDAVEAGIFLTKAEIRSLGEGVAMPASAFQEALRKLKRDKHN